MQKSRYSAGAVKLSFWFSELRKVITLLRSGKTIDEIKVIAERDNVFSSASPMRSKQIFSTVSARVKSLSPEFYELFEECGLDDQRIIALIAIINTDALFYEFMNDVYREKLIIGDSVLTDAAIRVFFLSKQRVSEKVAGWTDETIERLSKTYKVYLTEAGLIERGVGDRKIVKPLINNRIIDLLSGAGMAHISKVLTGTR
ncbi:MAG: DUF1819 family protein [Oscillospiraceae bacterium]|jgi:hypothetical protein|nr:DUF1819 family protein [Oscillospiraceae bacterium]